MDLLSHDILNKNQATLSYLELIQSHPGDERKAVDLARRAASQVRASSMLLDGIKRFVTATRRGSMPNDPVGLRAMLESVGDDLSGMFPYKRVEVDVSALSPETWVVGAQCTHDLFRNLLVNLVQLDPQDHTRLELSARREEHGGSWFWIVVVTAPTAVIPLGVDDSLFSGTVSADVSKMTRVSGTVFASSIARALGGRMTSRALDPDKNQGCVFEVALGEAGHA